MIRYDVSDGLCVLRLDAPPPGAITLEMLRDLEAAVRRAGEDADVRGTVITGGPEHFSAGADVRLFESVASREEAVGLSRRFQEAFRVIEDSPKPVAAAVAGQVLGGALELALACHVRVAARGSRFRLPEVTLGILPGAGGTQRLPRLVGLEAALRMMLRAETLTAEQALELGLVDAVCPGDMLLARCAELLRAAVAPRRTRLCAERLGDVEARQAAMAWAAGFVEAMRPELLAPRKIMEVVRTGIDVSVEAGFEAEQQALAECMVSPAARNRIYLFFATRNTAKPGVAFRPAKQCESRRTEAPFAEQKATLFSRAAVVGMGAMGAGIAQALGAAGLEVAVLDQDPAAALRGIERVRQSLARRAADGKMTQAQADAACARIRPAGDWDGLARAEVVIESVFEDLDAKRAVFARLAEVCAPDALLATNTSTLTLESLSSGMARPERLLGLHFFNPAHHMPLVEVVRRKDTPPELVGAALALVKQLRKTPVVVRSREGFLVNRIFVPYVQEAFSLLEEGAVPEAIDAAMRDFGFPMGPLELIDMAGLDILVHAQAVLARAFPWHGPLSPVALCLVEQGRTGQKAGAGVYQYEPGVRTPRPSPATAEIVAEVQRSWGRCPTSREEGVVGPSSPAGWKPAPRDMTERMVLRMVAEAMRVVEEGVARCQSDVDAASVLGMGFPDFRGGVLRYAGELGHGLARERLGALARQHGERFAVGQAF